MYVFKLSLLLIFLKIFNLTSRGKPSFPCPPQHPKKFPLYHFTCWDTTEFLGLKISWAGFPTCHKATRSPNAALKCLADQWTSTVDDSVDDNFSLNQHPNKILGRRDCYQWDIKGDLGTIPTLHCLSAKCFTSLFWNSFVWKASCVFRGKRRGWVALWSSKIFQVYLKRYFWKNFGKNCFLALENQFLLPDLMCEGKVLVLEFLAQVQHRKLKFIFPNPFCNSVWIKSSSTPRTNCFAAILIASELCHWHPS